MRRTSRIAGRTQRAAPELAAAVIAIVLLGACAGPPVAIDPGAVGLGAVEGMPDDFSLDLTVMLGPRAPLATTIDRRPSRFVLFPDGALHFGPEPEVTIRRGAGRGALPIRIDAGWLPQRTRLLTRRQMRELWSLLESLGFADPQHADAPTNFELLEPPRDGILFALACTGWGTRWAHVEAHVEAGVEAGGEAGDDDADGGTPARWSTLVRRLGALAWASERPEPEITVVPTRYDLGPDPYARYRR